MTHTDDLRVVIPIYNDWAAVAKLLPRLDRVCSEAGLVADVLLVDDGSTVEAPTDWSAGRWRALRCLDLLSLRRNVGHQRAIAIALTFSDQRMAPAALVVMDGDGEDAPEDIPRLVACLREHRDNAVVFAERTRRSESLLFQIFYALYRWAHWVLTGIPVRVGNFSVIPASQLRRLVVVSELWNHYAAAVFKSRVPRASVPTIRGERLEGKSQMNFVGLVTHGLSAFSVHSAVVGVRLLVVTLGLIGLMAVGLVIVIGIRLFTNMAIPGWTSMLVGFLLILLFQAVAFASFFAFLVLHARSQPTFIPLRDYEYFVDRFSHLVPAEAAERPATPQHQPA